MSWNVSAVSFIPNILIASILQRDDIVQGIFSSAVCVRSGWDLYELTKSPSDSQTSTFNVKYEYSENVFESTWTTTYCLFFKSFDFKIHFKRTCGSKTENGSRWRFRADHVTGLSPFPGPNCPVRWTWKTFEIVF